MRGASGLLAAVKLTGGSQLVAPGLLDTDLV